MSVEGIVLAAGLSSRFGSHKMVFRIDIPPGLQLPGVPGTGTDVSASVPLVF